MEHPTFYRMTQVDGLSIFYREAGPHGAPTLLLLHGLPSSSRMFAPLFARLSDCYHLVAPGMGATAGLHTACAIAVGLVLVVAALNRTAG